MQKNVIKYGIELELQLTVGTGNVNSVFPINEHEFIATTMKEIVKFEGSEIKATKSCPLECSVYVPPAEVVVCVTYAKHEFLVIPINNFDKPVLEGQKTDQFSIFHMIYSKESDSIITIGAGIKVWKFEYPLPNSLLSQKKKPYTLTLVSQFLPSYDSPLLNPPVFNYLDEELLLPSNQGIQAYKLNGKQGSLLSKVGLSKSSPFSFFQKSGKILTTDNTDIFTWNKFQVLTHRYTIPSESVSSLFMPDKENAVILSSTMNVFILNIKTGKYRRIFTLPQAPSKIFLPMTRTPTFVVSNGPSLSFYKVSIPWRTWQKGVVKPKLILRAPKYNEAARIFILSENNFMRFFSPKTRAQLTTAATHASSPILDVFYDRGFQKSAQRDELYVILTDGTICGFDTLINPCNENFSADFKAICMAPIVNPGLLYAFGTSSGELLICTYDKFEIKSRIQVSANQLPVRKVFFTGTKIVCIMDDEIVCVDPTTLQTVIKHKVNIDGIIKHNNGIIYVGKSTGAIERYEIRGQTIQERHSTTRPHNGQVTSITFSESFWMSTSVNGDIKVWDYSNTCLFTLQFDVPLYSSEVLNGTRNILVGTEGEIMLIPGYLVFNDEVDKEDLSIDNFDRLHDFLASETLKNAAREEMKRLEEEKRMKEEEEAEKREKKKPNKRIQAFRNAMEQRNQPSTQVMEEEKEEEEPKKKPVDYDEEERRKLLAEMTSFSEEPKAEAPKNNGEDERKKILDEMEFLSEKSSSQSERSLGEKKEEQEPTPAPINATKKIKFGKSKVSKHNIQKDDHEKVESTITEKEPAKEEISVNDSQTQKQEQQKQQEDQHDIEAKTPKKVALPQAPKVNQVKSPAAPRPSAKQIQTKEQQEQHVTEENKVEEPESNEEVPKQEIEQPETQKKKVKISEPKAPKADASQIRKEIITEIYNETIKAEDQTNEQHVEQKEVSQQIENRSPRRQGRRSKTLPPNMRPGELNPNINPAEEEAEVIQLQIPSFETNDINGFGEYNPLLMDPALVNGPLSAHPGPVKMASPIARMAPRALKSPKSNAFLFDINKFQERVNSANSDTAIADPKRSPVRYRKLFFRKDKGSFMSNRSMRTLVLPPLSPVKKEQNEEIISAAAKPKRSPTPPLIKKNVIDIDEIVLPKRSKTPEIEKKNTHYTAPSFSFKEVNELYGRGKNELQPLIIHSIKFDGKSKYDEEEEEEDSHESRSRMPKSFYEEKSQRKGMLSESLIIQPMRTYEDSQKVSANPSGRVKIIIPRRGRK